MQNGTSNESGTGTLVSPWQMDEQQPNWDKTRKLANVRFRLANSQGLVGPEELLDLRTQLAGVAAGRALIIQAGDCAEDPQDNNREAIWSKARLMSWLAFHLQNACGLNALAVGRIAGQYSKPRSTQYESVSGQTLPTYRGHMVNLPAATLESRAHDPFRMLSSYHEARFTSQIISEFNKRPEDIRGVKLWTSHEALVIDYEEPLLRQAESGETYLSSTHWPWIGERTRRPWGRHVGLLSDVLNPVACKVGPHAKVEDLIKIAELLNPERVSDKLAFIGRFGADEVEDRLGEAINGLSREGFRPIWLCDPMHGNTVKTIDNNKVRFLSDMKTEVRKFVRVAKQTNGVPGGIHLEITPDNVQECFENREGELTARNSRSLCDPRLNAMQALDIVLTYAESLRAEKFV